MLTLNKNMKRKNARKLRFIFVGFVGLIVIILTILYFISVKTNLSAVEIDFLDVGQGDASLIKLPNRKLILIDGGPDNLILKRLGENLPFYRRQIDLIVLSHPHDDHLIGLLEVVRRYKVESIIYMKGGKTPELLKKLLQAAQDKSIKLIALENEANINYLPGCLLKILNPLSLGLKEDDNNSLITKLDCFDSRALFMGDNSLKVEAVLLKSGKDLSTEVFKASHHGSKSANSEAFLKAINPKFFIISVGTENRFSHPNQEILERVNRLRIPVKRTDENGTIKIFKP